ncbi:hypothetical protein PR048_000080 [Dryococelus australis]|uniref:Uncharacterized protein n=1 Tax=Dryococelus australis TaxID=614101 RepID=A0ABQ9IFU7_9NEOP|nr:hypothetical protein PR048_000080 [Dryococelus australis]
MWRRTERGRQSMLVRSVKEWNVLREELVSVRGVGKFRKGVEKELNRGVNCVSGRTPYAYKGRKSCKETCIAAERDWAAMACDRGHDYLPEHTYRPSSEGSGPPPLLHERDRRGGWVYLEEDAMVVVTNIGWSLTCRGLMRSTRAKATAPLNPPYDITNFSTLFSLYSRNLLTIAVSRMTPVITPHVAHSPSIHNYQRHATFALLSVIRMNFTVLCILEPESFSRWLLHYCSVLLSPQVAWQAGVPVVGSAGTLTPPPLRCTGCFVNYNTTIGIKHCHHCLQTQEHSHVRIRIVYLSHWKINNFDNDTRGRGAEKRLRLSASRMKNKWSKGRVRYFNASDIVHRLERPAPLQRALERCSHQAKFMTERQDAIYVGGGVDRTASRLTTSSRAWRSSRILDSYSGTPGFESRYGYPDFCFHGFPKSLQANAGMIRKCLRCRVLPHHFDRSRLANSGGIRRRDIHEYYPRFCMEDNSKANLPSNQHCSTEYLRTQKRNGLVLRGFQNHFSPTWPSLPRMRRNNILQSAPEDEVPKGNRTNTETFLARRGMQSDPRHKFLRSSEAQVCFYCIFASFHGLYRDPPQVVNIFEPPYCGRRLSGCGEEVWGRGQLHASFTFLHS